jgi:hypothetical protein
MAGIDIEIKMPRRRAEVNVNSYWAKRLSIEEGVAPCHILGLFQDLSEDCAYPVMVCELDDGRVLTQTPETVKFVDIEEEAPL